MKAYSLLSGDDTAAVIQRDGFFRLRTILNVGVHLAGEAKSSLIEFIGLRGRKNAVC